MTTTDLDLTVEDEVARLTFQRPAKRNAITAEMWEGIASGLAEVARSGTVRALVVTGAGGSFSAGADLGAVRGADGARSDDFHALALRGIAAIRDFPRPTLAVIDGPCIGGGCSIALACDVRFATTASVFAVPAVRYGFSYDEGSLRRLVELVGSGHASRFLFSAVQLSAREAADIGLVELCGGDVQAEADSFISAVAAGDAAVISATRESIRRCAGLQDARS